MRRIMILMLFSWILGLSGCATQATPPVTEYTLAPVIDWFPKASSRLPLTLKLAPVSASQIYLSPQIYYVDDTYQRNPYAYSRWVDSPVHMLQLVLQDGLEQSGLFKAVLPASSMLQADLRLEATLFDFFHHTPAEGGSEGVVRMRLYLVDATSGKLLDTREFAENVPAPSVDASGGVSAINTAVARILPQMTNWLSIVIQQR